MVADDARQRAEVSTRGLSPYGGEVRLMQASSRQQRGCEFGRRAQGRRRERASDAAASWTFTLLSPRQPRVASAVMSETCQQPAVQMQRDGEITKPRRYRHLDGLLRSGRRRQLAELGTLYVILHLPGTVRKKSSKSSRGRAQPRRNAHYAPH